MTRRATIDLASNAPHELLLPERLPLLGCARRVHRLDHQRRDDVPRLRLRCGNVPDSLSSSWMRCLLLQKVRRPVQIPAGPARKDVPVWAEVKEVKTMSCTPNPKTFKELFSQQHACESVL